MVREVIEVSLRISVCVKHFPSKSAKFAKNILLTDDRAQRGIGVRTVMLTDELCRVYTGEKCCLSRSALGESGNAQRCVERHNRSKTCMNCSLGKLRKLAFEKPPKFRKLCRKKRVDLFICPADPYTIKEEHQYAWNAAHYFSGLLLSIISVTGPSLISPTSIIARNTPVHTLLSPRWVRRKRTNALYSFSASSGGA